VRRDVAEPHKKLRGARRYFRKLQAWPESVHVKLGGSGWYALWHQHPDFYGWSMRDGRARRAHLKVLFAAFRGVLREVEASPEPGQVFVTVNTGDSRGDALYVHTPNPNAKNYPFDFPGYTWDVGEVPSMLAEFVSLSEFEIGQTTFEGEKRYVVALGVREAANKPNAVDEAQGRTRTAS
jgi:hypothetical protein